MDKHDKSLTPNSILDQLEQILSGLNEDEHWKPLEIEAFRLGIELIRMASNRTTQTTQHLCEWTRCSAFFLSSISDLLDGRRLNSEGHLPENCVSKAVEDLIEASSVVANNYDGLGQKLHETTARVLEERYRHSESEMTLRREENLLASILEEEVAITNDIAQIQMSIKKAREDLEQKKRQRDDLCKLDPDEQKLGTEE